MKVELKSIHVGQAIDKRRKELKMSKTALGERIGVRQQHVNRILQRDTMETARLIRVCQVLDYNFFALFCPIQEYPSAYFKSQAGSDGIGEYENGESIMEKLNKTIDELKEKNIYVSRLEEKLANEQERADQLKQRIDDLKGRLGNLESNLKDKDVIIELLKERLQAK